jgi:hypothetical protein
MVDDGRKSRGDEPFMSTPALTADILAMRKVMDDEVAKRRATKVDLNK